MLSFKISTLVLLLIVVHFWLSNSASAVTTKKPADSKKNPTRSPKKSTSTTTAIPSQELSTIAPSSTTNPITSPRNGTADSTPFRKDSKHGFWTILIYVLISLVVVWIVGSFVYYVGHKFKGFIPDACTVA